MEAEVELEDCSEVEEINPIQYMMGNLMKKIDENKEPAQQDDNNEDKESPSVSVWPEAGQLDPVTPSSEEVVMVKDISSEFERTILESRAARLDSDQLKQEQDMQFNESAILTLKKVFIEM